ncbi:LOW QUALITY PROTEIN: MSL complex subunit 3 [Lepeophtheirus salmonis]|uniref:Uncharacterized protein n=1 Tax=Lepeophtheirus salmonis TaxID=72036 RepID=A0A0K2SYG3_LEPSM|nr:LOW QUALITY PROTEIN: male-specific lethal 3 homolog [Lepeophtheirus salmonis]
METKSSGSANIGIFQPNEWVLCYEPDPCKVKVIYNAKILEIEDGEYLVHFRGWNSSWDRRVTQEFLLKDNPANRILQRSLAQNVSKKGSPENRKKSPSRKRVLRSALHSNGNSDFHPPRKRPKREDFSIRISEPCKKILETDMSYVNEQGFLPIVPSVCPVVRVLEQYVRNFAERKVIHAERSLGRHNLLPVTQRESLVATELESIQSAIDLCKEMAEGLRIILDYNLNNILLYEKESEVCVSVCSPRLPSLKLPVPNSSRRPSTDRSSSSGRSTPTNSVGSLPSCSSSNKKYIFKCVTDSLEGWKLLPDTLYDESPPLPSLMYGPVYLLRLLVKLPEILKKMNLPLPRLKVLQRQISSLMDYLASHPEYFSQDMYSLSSSTTS